MIRTQKTPWVALVIVVLTACATPALSRQGSDVDAVPEERLRAAMGAYFTKRLRTDVGLSDTQLRAVVPQIEQLEAAKRRATRERLEAARRLRQAWKGGGSDEDLQRMLDRLDSIEWDQRQLEREVLGRIDAELSVRQRVRLRFFLPRFRNEIQQRVRELRGDGDGDGARGPGRWRRPR